MKGATGATGATGAPGTTLWSGLTGTPPALSIFSGNLPESTITNLTTDLGLKAPTARTITAGDGMTGGGDLSANRTLAVDGTVLRAADLLSVDLGSPTVSQTVDCVGAISVAIRLVNSTAANLTLALSHLALGVPVTISYANTSGSNRIFIVQATQPNGTAYTAVFWKTSAALVQMTSTGITVATGTNLFACGSATPTGSWTLYMVAN